MPSHSTQIPEDRDLNSDERDLLMWLIEHGNAKASAFLSHIQTLRVVSKCSCGCASINFSGFDSEGGLHILSDHYWEDVEGNHFGIFVFEKGGILAGLEVYSVDGGMTPTRLPSSKSLHP